MTIVFDVTETVVNAYDLSYDSEKLDRMGYVCIKNYLEQYDNNPWRAIIEGDVITDISLNKLIDYVDADCSTINF